MPLPVPSGTFRWCGSSIGSPSLESALLARFAPHLFTTRFLVLRGDDSEARSGWQTLAAALGVDPRRAVRLKQVHGRTVAAIRSGADISGLLSKAPEADVAVSDDPSVALAIRVADCVPLLIADRRTGAVAAAHAGWRGTAAGVAAAAVNALCTQFGSRPSDLVAAIGPSIGPCCYQVGEDVRTAFAAGHPAAPLDTWFAPDGCFGRIQRYRLDMWSANRDQLAAAGVPLEQIDVAALCTATHVDVFCSYRREGKGTGRMAGVIRAAHG